MKLSFPILFFLCLAVFGKSAGAQVLTEKLIFTATDSLSLQSSTTAFAKDGSYFIGAEAPNGTYFFYSNKTKYGPFRETMFSSSPEGDLFTASLEDGSEKDKELWYYRNVHSAVFFGPVEGKEDGYITKNTDDHVAVVVSHNDTSNYYVDNTLIARTGRESNTPQDNNWCAFSNNGNMMYRVKVNGIFKLFRHDQLIDTSADDYEGMEINDDGDYIYGKLHKIKNGNAGYNYSFTIHTKDTILGPVRTFWTHSLRNDGAYYIMGDDGNNARYIAINNHLYKGLNDIMEVGMDGKDHYRFTFKQSGVQKMNVNGTIYTPGFQKIYYPSFDIHGHFACFGYKDYYIYKYVDGKENPAPITRYGVRPIPLYISPEGEVLVIFKTDDSMYLFRDDSMLLKFASAGQHFETTPFHELTQSAYPNEEEGNKNDLFYLEIDTAAYIVYKGHLSKPIKRVINNGGYNQIEGQIVAGAQNQNGFFLIQSLGKKKYHIIVNNSIYKEVEGINRILKNSCFFDGKSLVFYGVKGKSFYQYTLSL